MIGVNYAYVIGAIAVVVCVDASCMTRKSVTVTNEDGSVEMYCLYKGIEMFPGSTIDDRQGCRTVICRSNALSICGLRSVSLDALARGCRLEADGCKRRIVQDEASLQKCRFVSETNGKPPATPARGAVLLRDANLWSRWGNPRYYSRNVGRQGGSSSNVGRYVGG